MELPTYKGKKYKITGERGDYRVAVFLIKPYAMASQVLDGRFRTKAIAAHMAKSFITDWERHW